MDDEFYKEEYIRVSSELEEIRRVEYDRQDSKL